MKKIFRIALYDFKRLVLNPIFLAGFIIVLVACLISGFAIKIPTTPEYVAEISGDTTQQLFKNFKSNKDKDSKSNLESILSDAQNTLNAQNSYVFQTRLQKLIEDIWPIDIEIKLFHNTGSCAYENDISSIINFSENFDNFFSDYTSLAPLKTNLFFTKQQFETLAGCAETLHNFVNSDENFSNETISKILTDIYESNVLEKIVLTANEVYNWQWDAEILTKLQNYNNTANEKLVKIFAEMQSLNSSVTADNIEDLQNMKNLATNYKLTCESAKFLVETELKMVLQNHFKNLDNLYNFEKLNPQDTKIKIAVAKHFLEDGALYYQQPQRALNFNTASYKVSVFDHSYLIVSIVGFLDVLFGIFITYKLFGRDRKNGKMDTILTRNVSFEQVFVGKFLAVIFTTSAILIGFSASSLLFGAMIYPSLSGSMLAVFNLNKVYLINPFLFFIIKVVGIELQVIFYSIITLFLMNISRKFDLCFAISILIFVLATILNIFLNGTLAYCLLPFIHADITSFLGGATSQAGFLKTSLYVSGNFFISLSYYVVVTVLLFSFTKQLFKKN